MAGCAVFANKSGSGRPVYHLHQSDHITIDHREGAWVRVVAPVAGWCEIYKTNLVEKSVGATGAVEPVVNLVPVSDLMFNRHGGARLHASNCGHTMHFDCWGMFYAANYSRFVNGFRSADFLAMDIERGEALCPMCKAVTNTLVPFTSKRTARDLLGEGSASDTTGSELSMMLSSSGDLLSNPCVVPPNSNNKCRMLYESCVSQQNLSWNSKASARDEIAYSLVGSAAQTDNLKIMRSLHYVWATAAYTLQCTSLKAMRERGEGVSDGLLKLSESDSSLIFQLVCTMRYCPTWFETSEDFKKFVSTPLRALIFDGNLVDSADVDSCRILDVNSATKEQVEKAIYTLPFRAVSVPAHPSNTTLSQILLLGLKKGVAVHDLYALLKAPLLSQDLNLLAVAVASSATDLSAFHSVNALMCLARLAQILIEPASLGRNGTFASASGTPESSADSVLSPMSLPDNRKKLKVDAFPGSVSIAHNSGEKLRRTTTSGDDLMVEEFASSLFAIRNTVCQGGAVGALSTAPVGEELVSLALDSWVPFLEFSYHLAAAMGTAQSGGDSVSPVSVVAADADTLTKLDYAKQLMSILKIDRISSLLQQSAFKTVISNWASQLRSYHGDESGVISSEVQWLPTVNISSSKDGSNVRHAASASSSKNTAAKTAAPTLSHILPASVMSVVSAAQSAVDRIALAANENEFDNLLSFLSGNDADNLIGGNSPAPPLRNDSETDFTRLGLRHGSSRIPPRVESDEEEEEEDEMETESDENEGGDHMMLMEDYAELDDGEDEDEDEENDAYLEDLMRPDANGFDEDIDDEGEDVDGENGLDGEVAERMLAQLMNNEDPAARGFIAEDDRLREEIMDYLRSTAFASTSSAANKKGSSWKLYGVDPSSGHQVDETHPRDKFAPCEALACLHSRQPLQGSVSGTHSVFGMNGERLTHVFPDLSHLGVGARHVSKVFVDLPAMYTDLYQMTKFPDGPDGITLEDPAICLVCGKILNAGNRQDGPRVDHKDREGECTLHSQQCGVGVGVFFLVQSCNVLLLRGALSSYYPSFYLDSTGELNDNRGQNRPMFLSQKRYKKLEDLYTSHQISREIARKRSTADSVVRLNWY